jgi:hypothetical protein
MYSSNKAYKWCQNAVKWFPRFSLKKVVPLVLRRALLQSRILLREKSSMVKSNGIDCFILFFYRDNMVVCLVEYTCMRIF